jgi:Glycosyltransferase family 87
MMARHHRPRVYTLIVGYVALALAWMAFAGWVMPALLTAEHPGRTVAAVKHYIDSFFSAFLPRDAVGRWRLVAGEVLIAILLHLTIVLILRRYDSRAGQERSPTENRADRHTSVWLTIISLVFLAVTVISGPIHDYRYFLNMWYEVEQGHNPWFLVVGSNGQVPLNAYGPLFNLLTGVYWVNSLAPKLLFAYSYILFSIREIKGFTATHRPSATSLAMLTVLFWNPFPWVEIAIRGHFDILVALLCLGAIQAWATGRDFISGTCLALGVLLKFLPVVLLPFLALDRGRIRPRFLFASIAVIALGLGLGYLVWGPTMFSPLTFVATRRSNFLSIFYFLRSRYSPIAHFMNYNNVDRLAPVILFVALLRAWSWYRIRHPDIEAACVIAAVVTAIFYHPGFPQYHMVPFVLGASWTVRHWGVLRDRPARIVAVAGYLGWLAVVDSYYAFIDDNCVGGFWDFVQAFAGLPTFLFGCAFLAAVVLSAAPASPGVVLQSGNGEKNEAEAGVDPIV